MANNENEIGASVAFTIASLLTTIATIFISVLATNTKTPYHVLFGGIGFLSVSTAALLIDWVLDEILKKVWHERIFLLNGGYLLFTIVISFVCFGVLCATYNVANGITTKAIPPFRHAILFSITGACIFLKTMVKKDKNVFVILLVVLGVLSFILIYYPNILLIGQSST
jgi:hypothetical protein